MNPARPAAIRRKVEAWLAEPDQLADGIAPQALALRARPEWAEEPLLDIAGTPVRVVPCTTPLAARAALYDRPDGERLVLLTDLTDAQLGDGLLAHLSRHTVRSVDPWDLVRQVFGNVDLDPGLVRGGQWAVDALSEYAPPGGWPVPAGNVLTRDHALRCLTGQLLHLDRDQIDSAGLLQWTTRTEDLLRFTALPRSLTDGISRFLVEIAGPAAAPITTAVLAGHGADAVPLGLLVEVLWPDTDAVPDTDVAVARARLEPYLGRPTALEARAFRDATAAWFYRAADAGGEPAGSTESGDGEVARTLARAEAIADEIGSTHLLAGSTVLPSGHTQRMQAFGRALLDAVPVGGRVRPHAVERVQDALARLDRHRIAHATTIETNRTETAWMAVRLLRWLAVPAGPAPATLYDALNRQVRDDAWVDRARLDVFAGSTDTSVADAYSLLYRTVDARRAEHDEQFARLLAQATAADAEPGALLHVEDVLDRVVVPLLQQRRRVLLLVLDGMSTAGSTELAESLLRAGAGTGWRELTPDGGPRTGVLAALPTVTKVSRCSLFSGAIATGQQAEERRAFSQRFPDGVLLHKGDLRAGAGAALDNEILTALEDPDRPLVAAVVNTIDDALDRSEPGHIQWGLETIPVLPPLLAAAPDRVVVIISDHGHVVDRGPESQTRPGAGGGNRWRRADTPTGDGEVLVSGRRVALGGGSVVLPWREELRYGPRTAGYHGGAAPAEAVIPLLVFTASDETALPGWSDAPVPSPDWWREPLTPGSGTAPPTAAPEPAAMPPRRGRRQAPPPGQDKALFEMVAPSAPTAPPPPAASADTAGGASELVEALLASEVYQQRRGTRAPLPDERVAALLGVLLDGGGRASYETLAARAHIPAHRITGTVTALRRLLQVEGYAVLDLDPDGKTVLLDRDLLTEQFQLDKP